MVVGWLAILPHELTVDCFESVCPLRVTTCYSLQVLQLPSPYKNIQLLGEFPLAMVVFVSALRRIKVYPLKTAQELLGWYLLS